MPDAPTPRYAYLHDAREIYRRSFAAIRAEADLAGLPLAAQVVAVRMIHGAGDIHLPAALLFHDRLVAAARTALRAGAPIFTDAQMLAAGVTRSRLPANNDVCCLLNDPRVAALAGGWHTTRSAAAVSLWGERLEGAVVAIGNAPTALFHLLELIHDGGPRPAVIIGMPVGFVGSAESKQALIEHDAGIPFVAVTGRRGGAALAASAINALAGSPE